MDKMTDARAVEVLAAMRDDGGAVSDADYTAAIDHAVARLRECAGVFVQLAERAVPFLRDEADKYEDDGSNEPLELAREIESALASLPSDESALPSANSAFDGGKEAAPCPHARGENCDCPQPPAEAQAQGGGESALVQFFRSEGHRFGWHGDQYGWTPEQTAIAYLRRLLEIDPMVAVSQDQTPPGAGRHG